MEPKKASRKKGGKEMFADNESINSSDGDDNADDILSITDGGDETEKVVSEEDCKDLFSDLPKKLRVVIKQGGSKGSKFFSPWANEVTTQAELYKVPRHLKDGKSLSEMICRANGLSINPSGSQDKFQKDPLHIIRPDSRIDGSLIIPITDRIAPKVIKRMMKHGSISTWVESTAAKAGDIDKENSDRYLALEILSNGFNLAALLEECHPGTAVYLNCVESMVRRLLVLEELISTDKKERSGFIKKKLEFMGLPGGAYRSTDTDS